MTTTQPGDLIGVNEAAEILGLTRQGVQERINRGLINPITRLGPRRIAVLSRKQVEGIAAAEAAVAAAALAELRTAPPMNDLFRTSIEEVEGRVFTITVADWQGSEFTFPAAWISELLDVLNGVNSKLKGLL